MQPAQYTITRAPRSGHLLSITADVLVRSSVALVATPFPRVISNYKNTVLRRRRERAIADTCCFGEGRWVRERSSPRARSPRPSLISPRTSDARARN